MKKAPPAKFIVVCVAAILALLLVVAVVLPRLTQLSQTHAAHNLYKIGDSISQYCGGHRGELPDSLETLVASEHLSADTATDPDSHQSFIYLGAGLTKEMVPAVMVVAYLPMSSYKLTPALFGDGSVAWLEADELKLRLSKVSTTQPTTHP